MYDILIKNALVVDGSGRPGQIQDVALKESRILAVDRDLPLERAARVLEGRGLALAPGFIDMHCHTDTYHIAEPAGEIKVRQGVCLDVVGNCGVSAAPAPLGRNAEDDDPSRREFRRHCPGVQTLADYAAALDRARPAARVMSHVGHCAIRIKVMGHSAQAPDRDQLAAMVAETEAALEQGAAGLSTGLYYPPSGFARDEELIALAGAVARRGRFHASHIRNEAAGLLDSLREVIRVGRAAGAATHISHLKAAGRDNRHQVEAAVELIETAIVQGLDLTCDLYPYDRSATTLLALIPPWAQEGGIEALTARLQDPRQRERILGQMADGLPGWENSYHNAGFEGISISSLESPARAALVGQTVAQAAQGAGRDPFELVCDLIAEEKGAVNIIIASMNEADVARFLSLPFVMIGSDGNPNGGMPHPRVYGAFPRVIRRFVRELGVISLETAVYKMSGLPARRLGLAEQGQIRPGYIADLVLFDPQTLSDTATYTAPRSYPEGVSAVIINGELVLDGGRRTAARPGGFVRAG
jgi:dihydroorotase/N-acyl-D-amino-acid deacylase